MIIHDGRLSVGDDLRDRSVGGLLAPWRFDQRLLLVGSPKHAEIIPDPAVRDDPGHGNRGYAVIAPDLPELEPAEIGPEGDLNLSGALVERAGTDAIRPARVRIRESELRNVVIETERVFGLELTDVIFRDGGLANVDARGGLLRRVEIERTRLVGFGLSDGDAADVLVSDCSLELASFAGATLRSVRFENVNLTDASFMHARLELVEFIDCRLAGADFRGAKVKTAAIRGASLDGVLGVESLRGVRMPWGDVLASAGALAAAIGITVEPS
jgi:uncharacterized protein YjbI with pentapeptide repeats